MQQRASGAGLTGTEVLALLEQARQSAEGKEALAQVQRLVSEGFYREPEASRDSAAGLADSGVQQPAGEHQGNLSERDTNLVEKIPEALRAAYEKMERQDTQVHGNVTQQGTGSGDDPGRGQD